MFSQASNVNSSAPTEQTPHSQLYGPKKIKTPTTNIALFIKTALKHLNSPDLSACYKFFSQHTHLLNHPLNEKGQTALILAVLSKNKAKTEILYQLGGDPSYIDNESGFNAHDYAIFQESDDISAIFEQYEDAAKIFDLIKKLNKTMDEELISFAQQPQQKKILTASITALKNYNLEKNHPERLLDLYCTANSIFKIISATTNANDLPQKIQAFFVTRENFLRNDAHDYCNTLTLANQLCAETVEILFPNIESPANILLSNAISENRSQPWFDETMQSPDLPLAPGDFFRTKDNEIHLYAAILDHVVEQLITNHTAQNEIWRGTDNKKPKENQALSDEDLLVIENRTPTLATLVNYTRKLKSNICGLLKSKNACIGTQIPNSFETAYVLGSDGIFYVTNKYKPISHKERIPLSKQVKLEDVWLAVGNRKTPYDEKIKSISSTEQAAITDKTKHLHATSIFQRLTNLRNGLLDGDVSHGGQELQAGVDAYNAIIVFSTWWNLLETTPNGKKIQTALCKLSVESSGRILNMETILNTLFIDHNNEANRGQSIYCIQILGKDLDILIQTQHIKDAINRIDQSIDLTVPYQKIKEWRDEINMELETLPPASSASMSNHFSQLMKKSSVLKYANCQECLDYSLLNSLLTDSKQNFLQKYLSNKSEQRTNDLVDYVFSLSHIDLLMLMYAEALPMKNTEKPVILLLIKTAASILHQQQNIPVVETKKRFPFFDDRVYLQDLPTPEIFITLLNRCIGQDLIFNKLIDLTNIQQLNIHCLLKLANTAAEKASTTTLNRIITSEAQLTQLIIRCNATTATFLFANAPRALINNLIQRHQFWHGVINASNQEPLKIAAVVQALISSNIPITFSHIKMATNKVSEDQLLTLAQKHITDKEKAEDILDFTIINGNISLANYAINYLQPSANLTAFWDSAFTAKKYTLMALLQTAGAKPDFTKFLTLDSSEAQSIRSYPYLASLVSSTKETWLKRGINHNTPLHDANKQLILSDAFKCEDISTLISLYAWSLTSIPCEETRTIILAALKVKLHLLLPPAGNDYNLLIKNIPHDIYTDLVGYTVKLNYLPEFKLLFSWRNPALPANSISNQKSWFWALAFNSNRLHFAAALVEANYDTNQRILLTAQTPEEWLFVQNFITLMGANRFNRSFLKEIMESAVTNTNIPTINFLLLLNVPIEPSHIEKLGSSIEDDKSLSLLAIDSAQKKAILLAATATNPLLVYRYIAPKRGWPFPYLFLDSLLTATLTAMKNKNLSNKNCSTLYLNLASCLMSRDIQFTFSHLALAIETSSSPVIMKIATTLLDENNNNHESCSRVLQLAAQGSYRCELAHLVSTRLRPAPLSSTPALATAWNTAFDKKNAAVLALLTHAGATTQHNKLLALNINSDWDFISKYLSAVGLAKVEPATLCHLLHKALLINDKHLILFLTDFGATYNKAAASLCTALRNHIDVYYNKLNQRKNPIASPQRHQSIGILKSYMDRIHNGYELTAIQLDALILQVKTHIQETIEDHNRGFFAWATKSELAHHYQLALSVLPQHKIDAVVLAPGKQQYPLLPLITGLLLGIIATAAIVLYAGATTLGLMAALTSPNIFLTTFLAGVSQLGTMVTAAIFAGASLLCSITTGTINGFLQPAKTSNCLYLPRAGEGIKNPPTYNNGSTPSSQPNPIPAGTGLPLTLAPQAFFQPLRPAPQNLGNTHTNGLRPRP
jgi:hypothetical protein